MSQSQMWRIRYGVVKRIQYYAEMVPNLMFPRGVTWSNKSVIFFFPLCRLPRSLRPSVCTSRAFPPKGTQTLTDGTRREVGESRGGRGNERASERPTSNEGGNISLSRRLYARAPRGEACGKEPFKITAFRLRFGKEMRFMAFINWPSMRTCFCSIMK